MAVRQYIGARYVPRFLDTFDPTQAYEALDVVDNGLGTSYIARIPTPPGTSLTDTTYWAIYGVTNGAIINLQNQIGDLSSLDPNLTNTDLVSAINDTESQILNLLNMRPYKTIADVVSNVANLSNGDIVMTAGYYAENDGGAAQYLISNVTTTTAYCIDITSGLYAVLIDDYSDVNVKKCGIHEGGSVTQAEADENADIVSDLIDVIYANHPEGNISSGWKRGGGGVYFPAGFYRFNKGIDINGKTNFRMHGAGCQETRISHYDSSVTDPFFTNEETDYSVIMSLHIYDLCFMDWVEAIHLVNAVDVEIDNCLFHGCTSYAIHINATVGMKIHDNVFQLCQNGVRMVSDDANSTSTYFERNWFQTITSTCVSINTSNNTRNFRTMYFLENIFEYCAYGINATGGYGSCEFTANFNHFENCSTRAIETDNVAFKLKDNDINTNVRILNPNALFYKIEDFENSLITSGYNNPNLHLVWDKKDGSLVDTVNNHFVLNDDHVTLGTYIHTSGSNQYRIKYTSSSGCYECVGHWTDGSVAFTPSTTIVTDGIAAPVTNVGGTVTFSADTGSSKRIEVTWLGGN